jgi:hypothetical protein
MRAHTKAELRRFTAFLAQLYESIQAVSSCKIIVDSSKRAAYAQILRRVSNLRLQIIHCVRDPRGASFSHFRRVQRPEITDRVEFMPRYGASEASVLWIASNILIQLIRAPRARLHYEDFAKHPTRELGHILAAHPYATSEIASVLDSGFGDSFPPNHTVAGNPLRFERGSLSVREDNRWRSELGRREELIILMLTWPLMLGYGYAPVPTHGIRR